MSEFERSSDYLKAPYARILIPDESGTFSAEILEFPGCFAQGATADEAFRNLEKAAESWIEAALDQGLEIPEPQMNQGYGGKIALRLPRSLHRLAVRLAEHDGTSLNQFLTMAIASSVGAANLSQRLERRILDTAARAAMAIAVSLKKETAKTLQPSTRRLESGNRSLAPIANTAQVGFIVEEPISFQSEVKADGRS